MNYDKLAEALIQESVLNEGILNKKYKQINDKIRSCFSDEYKFYFINIIQFKDPINPLKNGSVIHVAGFKDKIDPKYKSFSLGSIVEYNKDKCKTLLSNYKIKGLFTKDDLDDDLIKYTRFSSIFNK